MSSVNPFTHESGPLTTRVDGPIGEISFNRPLQKNAADTTMWRDLRNAVQKLNEDDSVLIIIVHGGEEAPFCAGADISEFDAIFETNGVTTDYLDLMESAVGALEQSQKPVLAAIEDVCIGGGVAIAAACDIRVCSNTTRFGVTPANLGIVYSYPDVDRLMRLVGEANAKYFLMTGELVDCSTAQGMGFVTIKTPTGDALAETRRLAQKMARKSQTTIYAAKRLTWLIANRDLSAEEQGRQMFLDAVRSDDFVEGVRAFKEKRRPNFPSCSKSSD